jgi:hypothetical protein
VALLDCRKNPNRERQRTQPRAAYIASKPPPAGGQPDRDETLTRAPAVAGQRTTKPSAPYSQLRRRAELSGRSVLRPFSRPIGNPPAVLPAAQDNNPASGSLSVSVSIGATIKNSAIRAPCVGANQCHCAIARPWCTQRLAIPSADRESGDARGWIRYFQQCLGERNGARDWRKRREQNGPSLSAPESDLSAQNLF